MYIEGGSIVQEAGMSFLTTWQNFYVITGTAAATQEVAEAVGRALRR